MKKIIAILLSIVVCMSFFSFGIIASENEISVLVDCKPIIFDVAPTTINYRTMVPMRAIFEALGATVEWNDSTQSITAIQKIDSYGTTEVKLRINSNDMIVTIESVYGTIGPVTKKLDAAPTLKNQRTLVPVRAISESMGCVVGWDETTQTVSIINDQSKYVMLYTPDGRSMAFPRSEYDAQLSVGWYNTPVQTLYAPGGKSQVFKQSEVAAQLTVGWFETKEEADTVSTPSSVSGSTSSSQDSKLIAYAAVVAKLLHSSMKDPSSFVLNSIYAGYNSNLCSGYNFVVVANVSGKNSYGAITRKTYTSVLNPDTGKNILDLHSYAEKQRDHTVGYNKATWISVATKALSIQSNAPSQLTKLDPTLITAMISN